MNKKDNARSARSGQGKGDDFLKGHPYFSTTGKFCAILKGGVLQKSVKGSKHMLRSPRGWALDKAIFDQALNDGARWILVTDSESGISYRSSIAKFQDKALFIDRGFGPQLVLALDYWSLERPGEAAQLSFALGGVR